MISSKYFSFALCHSFQPYLPIHCHNLYSLVAFRLNSYYIHFETKLFTYVSVWFVWYRTHWGSWAELNFLLLLLRHLFTATITIEWLNTLRPVHKGCHFGNDDFKLIFKGCIFFYICYIMIQISLNFAPRSPNINYPSFALNQVWLNLLTHKCEPARFNPLHAECLRRQKYTFDFF